MKKVNILYLCFLIVYVVVAAVAIIFGFLPEEVIFEKSKIVGALIALSSIPHLFIFVLQGSVNNKKKIPYAILGLLGIIFGLTCMYVPLNEYTLDIICIVWGAFDITRSTYELTDVLPNLFKKDWYDLIEVIISTGEIVVGILLIIHKFEGIKLHFIYLGFSFLVYFVRFLLPKLFGENTK